MTLNWYVLQVRTGKEPDIKSEMKRQGYTAAAPTEIRTERKGGKWHEKLRIVFPSYVFIKLDLTDEDFYKIRDVPGVIRFLGVGRPEPIREDEEYVIEWLDNDDSPLEPSGLVYCAGNTVMVVSGPLKGHEGTIIRINKRQRRALLAITINGSLREFSLSVKALDPREAYEGGP
jgi:transcriptional antiterminator NusG